MVLGEGGRVEDNQVVAVADVLQVLHGIGRHGRVGRVVAEVEAHVLVGEVHGALRRVHRAHLARTARQGVDGESARVAEGVEHRAACGVAHHQLAVLALVEEEARFLPLLPIDQELPAVFVHDVRLAVGSSPQVAVHRIQSRLVGQGLRAFVVDGREPVAEDRAQGRRDVEACSVHAHRVALHDCRAVVYVDDQPGEPVAFAVYEAVAVGLGRFDQTEGTAHVERHADAVLPPCGVDGLRLVEREDTHGDGADLVVSAGDEVAGMGAHFDQGALRDFGLLLGRDVVYGTREDPGVAAQQGLFLTSAQMDLGYHRSFCVLICVCRAGARRCGCRPRRRSRRRAAVCR